MKIFFFMIFFFVLLKIFPEIVAENQIKFKSDFFIRKFSNNFIVFELLVVIYWEILLKHLMHCVKDFVVFESLFPKLPLKKINFKIHKIFIYVLLERDNLLMFVLQHQVSLKYQKDFFQPSSQTSRHQEPTNQQKNHNPHHEVFQVRYNSVSHKKSKLYHLDEYLPIWMMTSSNREVKSVKWNELYTFHNQLVWYDPHYPTKHYQVSNLDRQFLCREESEELI